MKYRYLITVVLVSIFIYSCVKDENANISEELYYELNESIIGNSVLESSPCGFDASENEGNNQIVIDTINYTSEYEMRKVREITFGFESYIDYETIVKQSAEDGKAKYAINVYDEKEFTLTNLIIVDLHKKSQNQMYVIEYNMSTSFAMDYYECRTNLGNFEGEVQFFTSENYFLKRKSDCNDFFVSCCPSVGGISGGTITGPGGNDTDEGGEHPCDLTLYCVTCSCINKCHPETCMCLPPKTRSTYAVHLTCRSRSINRNPDCCPNIGDGEEIPLAPEGGIFGHDEDDEIDPNNNLQCRANGHNFRVETGLPDTGDAANAIDMAAECGDCDCGEVGTQAEQDYMDCVATQIIENSPCKGALENFMEEYGVDLSLEEQVSLIGPGECGSGFEEDVVNNLFEMRNPIISQIYDQITDGSFENKILFLNRTTPNLINPPECDGCNPSELQDIWDAEIKALDMLDCIVEKFDNQVNLDSQLLQYFDSSNPLVAAHVAGVFRILLYNPYERTYKVQNLNEGFCNSPDVLAWSWPLVQATSVRICRPAYFNLSSSEKASTLIHEWTHLHVGTNDWAYPQSPGFPNLNTFESLTNAASYEEFIKSVCP